MWSSLGILLVFCGLYTARARPPIVDSSTKSPIIDPEDLKKENGSEEWNKAIEYTRYLQEVVQVLESDTDFRKKLETVDVEKIRDGSIADELDFVNHKVRSKLDDIKRQELERLRHLAMKEFEQNNGIDREHIKMPVHLEVDRDSFEKEDLKKLILSTTRDLEQADKNRRDEFKQYEMKKRMDREERLRAMQDEGARKAEEEQFRQMQEKHKKHERPHHPMTKEQLEEVWEEKDHMRADEFDPKTFFALHDLNGDGAWDQDEVKMLFEKELDKVYDKNAPEDDMKEREEEMERMREHTFKESDADGNNLITFEEFLAETKRDEFDNDPGWDTIDEEDDPFSDEEFRAYEMQRQREIADYTPRSEHRLQEPVGQPNLQHDVNPAEQRRRGGVPGQAAFKPDEGYLRGGGASAHHEEDADGDELAAHP